MIAAVNDVSDRPVNVVSHILSVGIMHQVDFVELVNPGYVIQHDAFPIGRVAHQLVALSNVALDGVSGQVLLSVLVGDSVAFTLQIIGLQGLIVGIVNVLNMRFLCISPVGNDFVDVAPVVVYPGV